MNILSKFFNVLETHLVPPRLSLWRTVYFNFRTQPFSRAVHMPFYIYGRVKFPTLAGRIEIVTESIQRGMIRIGQQDPFCASTGQGSVAVSSNSRLVFFGPCHISTNVCLNLLAGEFLVGKFVLLGSCVKVIVNGKSITIGDYSRVAFQSVIVNSGFHSIVDLQTMSIQPHIRDIIIGSKCWIGNSSSIYGGAKLKDGTIVGTGSYVNKDFTLLGEEHQLLAGRPAKLIKSELARIWSPTLEMRIIKWFQQNPDFSIYHLSTLDEDSIIELEKEYLHK